MNKAESIDPAKWPFCKAPLVTQKTAMMAASAKKIPAKPAVPSTCKLCLKTSDVSDSHIMPKFFIRRIQHQRPAGKAGQTRPYLTVFSLNPNVEDGPEWVSKWENELGLKEPMLCKDCEEQFSKYEGYARELLYGKAPGPLKKIALGVFHSMEDPIMLGVRIIQPADFDFRLLKLFQLSILWRAGVASGRHYTNVSLGPKHEERLRQLLVAESPGNDYEYCCPMADLRYKGVGCEDWTQTPECARDKGSNQRIYKIALGGYLYIFHVANEPPPQEILNMSARAGHPIHMPVANPQQMMKRWAVALYEAEALKGGPIDGPTAHEK
jgi:hypothetical protein